MLAGMFGASAGSVGPTNPYAVSIWAKLVAWYEHDETSGTTMVDSHGGLDGTYTSPFVLNQAALAPGLSNCVEFTTSNGAGQVPADPLLNLGTTYAVMSWISRTTNSQPSFSKILWKPTDTLGGRGTYYLSYETSGTQIRFRFNSSSNYYDATGGSIAINTTYCIIGNKLTTGSELYVNNSMVGSQASGGAPDTSVSDLYQGSSGSSDGMIGYYGPTALFSAPLTTDEIDYLYSGGNGVNYATLKTESGH
jgi:hypothetical protein